MPDIWDQFPDAPQARPAAMPAPADPWAAFPDSQAGSTKPVAAEEPDPMTAIEGGPLMTPGQTTGLLHGIYRGAIEQPVEGLGQLLAHSLPESTAKLFFASPKLSDLVTGKPATIAERVDAEINKREQEFQELQRSRGIPEGGDVSEGIGAVLSPINLAAGEGTGLLARETIGAIPYARSLAYGLGTGGGMAAVQPVTNSKDYWADKAIDAGVSAGIGGPAAMLGRALVPEIRPEAQRLYDAGVQVTPSQAIGGTARSLTSKAASLPVVGENIARNTENSLESFQRSRMNLALSRVGAPPMPEDMPIDRNAIEHVSDTISQYFQQHIPRTVASFDGQFAGDMTAILDRARQELPDAQFNELTRIGRSYILEPFNRAQQATGRLDVPGRIAQTTDRTLGDLSRDLAGENNSAWDRRLGNYVRETQEAFRGMLIRGSPADASQGVQDARRAWAEYAPIRDAAAMQGSEQGRFTPAQYLNAVRRQALTREQYATNTGPVDYQARQQAAEDAKAVLPNKVPNSATTDRRAFLETIAALAGAHAVHPGAVGGVLAGVGATTPAASRLGTYLLMHAPGGDATARALGSALARGNVIANQPQNDEQSRQPRQLGHALQGQ